LIDYIPPLSFWEKIKKMKLHIIVPVLAVIGVGIFFWLSSEPRTKPPKDEKVEQPKEQPIVIQSIKLLPEKTSLKVGESGDMVVELTPENADKSSLKWESDPTSVATVSDAGFVEAVGEGIAIIRVIDTKGNAKAESTIIVSKSGSDKDDSGGGGGGSINTITFDYGIYTGEIRNGRANGMGELKYTKAHQINPNDPEKRTAQPGDRIQGQFENNLPTTVRWYDQTGALKGSVIVGSTGL
jgi:hypothetical protein